MRIETIMRALADPTRLRIMRLLSAMELAVGELAQVLGQSQPRVSRHVGILSPVVHTIPVQLLAYHAALARGTDVDKPRNLAKSVTVE